MNVLAAAWTTLLLSACAVQGGGIQQLDAAAGTAGSKQRGRPLSSATGGLGSLRDETGGCGASCAGGEGGATGETPVAFCGDGLINRPEERCDDGNSEPGDGCTAACDQIEAYYVCPTPGDPCVYTVECGDGLVGGTETCDDGVDDESGRPVAGDGCSETCQVEEGFGCPVPNAACRPICGDGLIVGREQCDDGDVVPGDGCGDTCQLDPGWVCPQGEPCRATVCGDGIREGSEQCDDGNLQPYDDCGSDCVAEPQCGTETSPVGPCVSACGDGIMLASDNEECDDGNTLSGDGCSDTCQLEAGYECLTIVDDPPDAIDLPVVLRDFRRFTEWADDAQTIPVGHPDFERICCQLQTGMVEPLLGLDRKPVYAGTDAAPAGQTTGKAYFDQWYRDVDGVSLTGTNLRFDRTLHLVRRADGSYSMDSATDEPWATLGGYFPLDDLGWGTENLGHNFHFTSEVRYWFEYKGGEVLEFSGDDDVWVFLNGTLGADLGGVHVRSYATVELGMDGHGLTCTGDGCTPAIDIDFGLAIGNIYEVVVFQAERHTGESNYWLTLANFLAGRSTCNPRCGDGVQTPDEACDLGEKNNTGEHGGCNPDCTLAPFCGDGHVDTDMGEQCDDGVNTSLYGGCGPGCVEGPYCGDSEVQPPYEQCDDGTNDGGYGECDVNCQYGPRCGDGILQQEHEECDDGNGNGSGACREDCTLLVIL